MDREKLDVWLERGITGLVLAILAFAPLATGAVRPIDFGVVQGLTGLALLMWLVRFWVNPSHRVQWPPICWAIIAFLILAVVRYTQADVEYVARLELTRIAVYACLFALVLNNLHRQETCQWVVVLLLGVGMILSVLAIYQFATGSSRIWGWVKPIQYGQRGSGTFICPNHLAGYLELLLPIALSYVFLSKVKPVFRVFYGYTAVVLLGGIATSVSRAGWLSTGIMLLFLVGFLFRYQKFRVVSLVTLVVIFLAGAYFYSKADYVQKRFLKMNTPGQAEAISVRPMIWNSAKRMWGDHLWFGVGPGHFDVYWQPYRHPAVQARPFWVHNDYLNVLADWGIVGGSLLGGVLVCLGIGVFKTWKYVQRSQDGIGSKGSDRAALVFGISLGLGTVLIHTAVDFQFQVPAIAVTAVVLAAILTSHLRFSTARYWVSPKTLGRILATLVCGVALVFLFRQSVQRFQEHRYLKKATQETSLQGRIQALKQAWEVDPSNPDTAHSIGEAYRTMAWEGDDFYREYALEGMHWFLEAMKLHPLDAYHPMRYAMCADWLGQHGMAEAFLRQALKVDPSSYYLAAMVGWHQLQQGSPVEARQWFEHSKQLKSWANYLADQYLLLLNKEYGFVPAKPFGTPPTLNPRP